MAAGGYTKCENCKGKGTVKEPQTITVKGVAKVVKVDVTCSAGCTKGNVIRRLL